MKIAKTPDLSRKFLALILALFMLVSIVPLSTMAVADVVPEEPQSLERVAPDADIDWYENNPDAEEFNISEPAELYGLMYLVNRDGDEPYRPVSFEGKTIKLDDNIDLSGLVGVWVGIGWGDAQDSGLNSSYCHFKGTFDGQGYTISGLTRHALFGTISDATIKNLVTSGNVRTGVVGAVYDVAGVVRFAIDSVIDTVSSDVNLIYECAGSALNGGGIVAHTAGTTTVSNSVFNGTYFVDTAGAVDVMGVNQLGGIVGQVGFTKFDTLLTVVNCVNNADLTSNFNIGGIVGGTGRSIGASKNKFISANIVIQNSINNGAISNTGYNNYTGTGGILGASGFSNNTSNTVPASVTISGCANTGEIIGLDTSAGGLVGYVQQGDKLLLANSYNWGRVTTNSDVNYYPIAAGGIAGRVDNVYTSTISNTYNTGTVILGEVVADTQTSVGDFIGKVDAQIAYGGNNYFLGDSAGSATGSGEFSMVYQKSEADMTDPSFAGVLGEAYVAVDDDYPILAWQDETVVEQEENVNQGGVNQGGATTPSSNRPVPTDSSSSVTPSTPSTPSTGDTASEPALTPADTVDLTEPPSDEASTTVATLAAVVTGAESGSQGQEVFSFTVTTPNGGSIPPDVKFYIWFIPEESSVIQSRGASVPLGPFVTKSAVGGILPVDVNALEDLDGKKASIDPGTYTIKYADETGTYIGTTSSVATQGTRQAQAESDSDGSGSGGCDAGFGAFALLAAAGSLIICGKREKKTESDLDKAA